jgi:hypothetical protein
MKQHEILCRSEFGKALIDGASITNIQGVSPTSGYLVLRRDAFQPIRIPLYDGSFFLDPLEQQASYTVDVANCFRFSWLEAYRHIRDVLINMRYYIVSSVVDDSIEISIAEKFTDDDTAIKFANANYNNMVFDIANNKFIQVNEPQEQV